MAFRVSRGTNVRIRVGTSGWSYPEWRGRFYPRDLPAARMLAYYAAHFSTVEVNATFYRMPRASQLVRWAAAVPEGFVFAVKAPRRITHHARLRDVDEPVRAFADAVRALGSKLGPVLFQFPPSFPKELSRLGDLLAAVPPGLAVAIEFRHPSWFCEEVYARLRAWRAALCLAETAEDATPAVDTADFGYLRLRARMYTDAALRAWVERIRTLGAHWREAYVFFKHEATGVGPVLARRLLGWLPEAGTACPPLTS